MSTESKNYWQRMRRNRLSRRELLRASARAGVGAAGLALVGCGDDDDAPAAVSDSGNAAAEAAERAAKAAEAAAEAARAAGDTAAAAAAEAAAAAAAEAAEAARAAGSAEASAAAEAAAEAAAAAQDAADAASDAAAAAAARDAGDDEEEAQVARRAPGGPTDFDATVTLAIPNAVGGLDPHRPGNFTTTFNSIQVFDRPLTRDLVTRELIPLSASFEWADDNTAGIYTLYPGMKWSDGEPVTARDFKFSFDRLSGIAEYNANGVYETGADYIVTPVRDEITVIDDLTYRVPLETDVTAPGSMNVPIVPKHFVEAVGDDQFNQEIVSSGPFQLTAYTADQEVRHVRNEDYHRPVDGYNVHKPFVKELVQIVRPEPLARIAALEAGEVDLITRVEPELIEDFKDRPGFTVNFDPGCCPHTIFPNTLVPLLEDGSNPFEDIRVRKAMNHAIDVETIIATLGSGQEIRTYGIASRSLGALTPDQRVGRTYEYNLFKAQQLMDAAGYADGFDTPLYGTVGFFASTDSVALVVQQSLKKIGINASLTLDPLPDFRARFAQKDVPGLHYYFTNQAPDPISVINAEVAEGGTLSTAIYPDSGIQELVEAQRVEFDPVKRKKLMNDLAIRIYENANWIFLYETVETGVMRDHIEWDAQGNTRDHNYHWAIRPTVV